VREAIGVWHREGRTLDEILDALDDAFGVKISRSALHRHVKGMDKALERIERGKQIAEAAVRQLGHEPESKTARANIELMQAAIMEIMSAEDDQATGRAVAKPMDAMLLAKALEHLTKASRHDAEYIGKVREAAAKEAAAKMEKAAAKAVAESAEGQLSPDAVLERIRAIYRGEA
jgi:hypothetical protein